MSGPRQPWMDDLRPFIKPRTPVVRKRRPGKKKFRYPKPARPVVTAEEQLQRGNRETGRVRLRIEPQVQVRMENPRKGQRTHIYAALHGKARVLTLRSPGAAFALLEKLDEFYKWLETHGDFPRFN